MFNSRNFNPAPTVAGLNMGNSFKAFAGQQTQQQQSPLVGGQFQPFQAQTADAMDFGLPASEIDISGLSIAIRKVYLGETRSQREQWRRNYNAFVDGDSFGKIQEAVAQDETTMRDPIKLSGFFADNTPIVRYSAHAETAVNVDNGWDFPRFRFTLVIDVYRNGRFVKTEFVSGYTDSQNVTNRALANSINIDPNMVFHINQITDAATRMTGPAGEQIPLISGSHQVLQHTSFTGIAGPQLMTMCPSDVVGAVGRLEMYTGMDEAAGYGVDGGQGAAPLSSFRDMNVQLTGMPVLSSADNVLIPTYTSRIVNALYSTQVGESDAMQMDNPYGAFAADNTKVVKNRIKEASFLACNFVNLMNRKLANGVSNTASFCFGDLLKLDNTVDDRALIFGLTFQNTADGLYVPDGTGVSDIGKTSNCALAASCVANSLVQLMSKAGVSLLAIHVDNFSGADMAVIQGCNGMDYDGNLKGRLEYLKARLIMEAVPMIKPDPGSVYEIDVLADAFNDVYVQIRIDGEYDQFLIPAYASSAFAPVVTNDMGNVVGMAKAIDHILTACTTTSTGGQILNQFGNAFSGVGTGSNFNSDPY